MSLGQAITAYRCYGVYKDFNGNAPDTANLVLVATEELAKIVAKRIEEIDNESREAAEAGVEHEYEHVAFPRVEGWEWSAHYSYRPAIGEVDDIATSAEDAIKLPTNKE